MYDKNVLEEELENRLRFYDQSNSGYIEQTDLKNVLAELGLSLTLSELVKIVKIFPINQKNHVHYRTLVERLDLSDGDHNDPITYEEFVKVLQEKFLTSATCPVSLPISVRKLTSELQTALFKG